MSFCLAFFQSYTGWTEKNPIVAALGSMPFACRTCRTCSASLDACWYAACDVSSCTEMSNWSTAVSGADSNLPSAPTYTEFGSAVRAGCSCANDAMARTKSARRQAAVFIKHLSGGTIEPKSEDPLLQVEDKRPLERTQRTGSIAT